MVAGLLGLATYAPSGRLSVDEVRRHWGSAGPPGVRTVAVAGFDEDTVTMAVEALDAVLSATGRTAEDLDALYFATGSLRRALGGCGGRPRPWRPPGGATG
jgi:3-hydroxy-3-methylglutaryl CoA synthase